MRENWFPSLEEIPTEIAAQVSELQAKTTFGKLLKQEPGLMMVTILLGLIPDLQWRQIYEAGMGMTQKKLRELLDGMQRRKIVYLNERHYNLTYMPDTVMVAEWLQHPAFNVMRGGIEKLTQDFLKNSKVDRIISYDGRHYFAAYHSNDAVFLASLSNAEAPQFLTPRMVARLLRVMGYHEQAWTMLTRFASRPNYLDPRIPSYEHYGSVALRQLYYQLLGNKHEDATTQPESMRAGVLRDNIAAKSLVRRNEDSSMTCREWVQKLCRCEKNEGVLCAIIFHELQSGSWQAIEWLAKRSDIPDTIASLVSKLLKWKTKSNWSALRGLLKELTDSAPIMMAPLAAIANRINKVSMKSVLDVFKTCRCNTQEKSAYAFYNNANELSESDYKLETTKWDISKPIGMLPMLLGIMNTGAKRTAAEQLQAAVDACFKLHANGLTLYSWYMASILSSMPRISADTRRALQDIINSRNDLPAIPGITPFANEDEMVLDKFLTLSRELAGISEQSTASAGRMEWQIEASSMGYATEIIPILRKSTPKGKLSDGRIISLSYLLKGKYDEYVTAEDKIMMSLARREHSYYGDSCYMPVTAARALCRHPHVRVKLDKQLIPDAALTLVAPKLNISQKNSHMQLSLPADAERVKLVQTGEKSFDLYVPTPGIEKMKKFIESMGVEGKLMLPISAQEKISDALAALTGHFSLAGDVKLAGCNLEEIKSESRLVMLLRGEGGSLSGVLHVEPFADGPLLHPGKGESQQIIHKGEEKVLLKRNLTKEKKQAAVLLEECSTLRTYCSPDYHLQTDDLEIALEILAELQDAGADKVELRWPAGCTLSLSSLSSMNSFQVTARESAHQWFEIGGKVNVDEGLVLQFTELLNLYRQRQGRYIRLDDNRYLRLTSTISRQLDTLSALQPLPDKGGKVRNRLGLTPAAVALLATHCTPGQLPEALEKPVQSFRNRYDKHKDAELPKALNAELRDYQMQGFRWLMRQTGCGLGACLADDMGLGKTLQILTVLLARAKEGPSLVLVPASVCGNWVREAARFTPTLSTVIMGNTQREETLQKLGPRDVLVCSYGLLVTEVEILSRIEWNVVVLDEAQAIKNSQSQRAENTRRLNARYRIAATGTPLENNLMELWSLMQFLNPDYLGAQSAFMSRFKDATGRLHKLVAPFILRRVKNDVLDELPEKTERVLQIDLNERERALYESIRREAMQQLNGDSGRFQVLAMLTKLRRLCCLPSLVAPDCGIADSSKMDALRELTAELRASGHRALIFSQFTDVLAHVQQLCQEEQYSFLYLDGSTPTARRMQLVDTFQQGETDFFLISLKAGGVGLNLTAADYVILLDPWWNPAVENQAADRTHRIGQKKPVTVCRMVCSDTIEEKVLSLHSRKREMFDSIINDTESNAGTLSVQELLKLMS